MAWSDAVSAEQASRRAGGRRRYNRLRQDIAVVRRAKVARLLRTFGVERGAQAQIARQLGVSEATISRDAAHLRSQSRWL